VGRARVEIHAIARLQNVGFVCMANLELPFQEIEELIPGMDVRTHINLPCRKKFRVIRVKWAIGNHISKALEVVAGVIDSSLGQPNALAFAMDTEEHLRLGLKEVRKILAEHHRNPGQIP
jgi:hypothetical protein